MQVVSVLSKRGRTVARLLCVGSAVLLSAVLSGVLSACGSSGRATTTSSAPTAPAPTPASASASGPSIEPEGFDTTGVVIRRADGSVCRLCTYVARNEAERERGLMRVTNLGGYDGMLFDFDGPSTDRFWMRNTVMPLTAVWFAPGGALIAAVDMAPCPDSAVSCPSYGPGTPADFVLELPQGDAQRWGIAAGSTLESVGVPCDAAAHRS